MHSNKVLMGTHDATNCEISSGDCTFLMCGLHFFSSFLRSKLRGGNLRPYGEQARREKGFQRYINTDARCECGWLYQHRQSIENSARMKFISSSYTRSILWTGYKLQATRTIEYPSSSRGCFFHRCFISTSTCFGVQVHSVCGTLINHNDTHQHLSLSLSFALTLINIF